MKKLVHIISLKRQAKRDVESALHDQECGILFSKLVYVSNLVLKLTTANKSLLKITLKSDSHLPQKNALFASLIAL